MAPPIPIVQISVDPTCRYVSGDRNCLHDVVVTLRGNREVCRWYGHGMVSYFMYYSVLPPEGTCFGKLNETATRPAPSEKYPREYWEAKEVDNKEVDNQD
jgi:hypothetical protein